MDCLVAIQPVGLKLHCFSPAYAACSSLPQPATLQYAGVPLAVPDPSLQGLTERHLSELVPFQILVANETPPTSTVDHPNLLSENDAMHRAHPILVSGSSSREQTKAVKQWL